MSTECVINVDLADVWKETGRKELLRTLVWGDDVTVVRQTASRLEIETVWFRESADGSITPVREVGFIEPKASGKLKAADVVRPKADNAVLKVNFVDVQQGDGALIEAPDGTLVLVDGGENAMFARYLAARYRGTSAQNPKVVDCVLVTHGDADHFLGLPEIQKSETNAKRTKRLFIQPRRYYHNGIVKGPSTRDGKAVSDVKLLGATAKFQGRTYLTGLVDDLLTAPADTMNQPFKAWRKVLAEYHRRAPLTCRRLQFGDTGAFDFFNRPNFGLKIEVLGPLVTTVNGGPALRFLGDPPAGPRLGHESLSVAAEGKGHSASHTINGHSIVLRLVYGGFSFLFAGDLNDEAGRFLTVEHNTGRLNLKSEVFKAPHHGSADFSGAFIQAVSPVVSVVSSGDENARKEYIHPRATLMGALGKWSRVPEPLVFVTELVAFFQTEGWSRLKDPAAAQQRGDFFGFSRTIFGLVKTRTDGKRLLVVTDSGNVAMKEAYAYSLDADGAPQPSEVVRA